MAIIKPQDMYKNRVENDRKYFEIMEIIQIIP